MKEERSGFIPTPLPLMREAKAVSRPRKYVERLTRRYRRRIVVKEINGEAAGDSAIVDISATGLKLDTARPLAMHDLVELTCLMPLTGEERRLGGKVVWVKAAAPFGQRYLAGLKFFKTEWDITMLAKEWEEEELIE